MNFEDVCSLDNYGRVRGFASHVMFVSVVNRLKDNTQLNVYFYILKDALTQNFVKFYRKVSIFFYHLWFFWCLRWSDVSRLKKLNRYRHSNNKLTALFQCKASVRDFAGVGFTTQFYLVENFVLNKMHFTVKWYLHWFLRYCINTRDISNFRNTVELIWSK